jgi:hypothetical protein
MALTVSCAMLEHSLPCLINKTYTRVLILSCDMRLLVRKNLLLRLFGLGIIYFIALSERGQ